MSELNNHFVDAAGHDLHLLETSPAVDAAVGMAAPARDRDGIPRPQGNGIDVGAYEWHAENVEPGGTSSAGAAGGPGPGETAAGGTHAGGGVSVAHDASSGEASTASAPATPNKAAGGCGCSIPGRATSMLGIWALLAALACCAVRRVRWPRSIG